MSTPIQMESAPGPETVIDGVRYLYFGGTSYLGLAAHPEVIEAGCEALRRYGVHSATTRARFGTIPPVLEVERKAAEFFGVAGAFYFSSGYMANHILVSALADGVDAVLVEEGAHFCVLEAARLAQVPGFFFRAAEPDSLRRIVAGARRPMILADAVGPASGILAPVTTYLEILGEAESGTLLLDDAHGFGVLGANGRGLLEELGYWSRVNGQSPADRVQICVGGTLAKAMGGFGGIIPGTPEFVSRVRGASHYFDGASAPASAVAGSTARALELVLRNPGIRLQLRENILRLRRGLRLLGFAVPDGGAAQLGVAVGNAENMKRIHETLKKRGVWLPYFPAYSGISADGVLRFAVFATHSSDQIDCLLAELKSLL